MRLQYMWWEMQPKKYGPPGWKLRWQMWWERFRGIYKRSVWEFHR